MTSLGFFPYSAVFLLVSARWATAIPVSTAPEESPPPIFAVWLCIPFVLLATLKLIYMKFRRAQSIHNCDSRLGTSMQVDNKSRIVPSFSGLGFKLPEAPRRNLFWKRDITGYLVGFLGSPTWETRIKRRVDRVIRRSKTIVSTATSPRISFMEHSTVSGDTGTHTSKGTVSRANTTLSSYRHSTQGSKRSGSNKSRSARVSFLELQTPQLPSSDITNCSAVHPGSPACPEMVVPLQSVSKDDHKSAEDPRWRRRRLSMSYFSPVVMHAEPPPIPVSDAVPKRSLDTSVKSSSEESHRARSYSKTPSFQDASTTSNVSSDSVASLASGEITVNLSVSQPPASPNPEASVLSYPHSVSESLDEISYILSPDGTHSVDWSVEEVMKVPRRNRIPRRSQRTAEGMDTRPSVVITAPLSPSPKTDRGTSFALNRSGSDKSTDSTRLSAGTDAPHALAMQLLAPVGDSQPNSQRSSANSAANDWILEDLLRDGKLDVDAVSGVLGLDLAFLDEPTPASDSIFGNMSHLSENTSPSKDAGVAWGCAITQSGSTSFDIQIRKPGGPLCVIPEETDSVMDGTSSRGASQRWSNGSLLSAHNSKGSGQPSEAPSTSWIAT